MEKRSLDVYSAGDTVVNCCSQKLFFRKQIGEDFPISKLVYGDSRYPCRHPNRSLGMSALAPRARTTFPASTIAIILELALALTLALALVISITSSISISASI